MHIFIKYLLLFVLLDTAWANVPSPLPADCERVLFRSDVGSEENIKQYLNLLVQHLLEVAHGNKDTQRFVDHLLRKGISPSESSSWGSSALVFHQQLIPLLTQLTSERRDYFFTQLNEKWAELQKNLDRVSHSIDKIRKADALFSPISRLANVRELWETELAEDKFLVRAVRMWNGREEGSDWAYHESKGPFRRLNRIQGDNGIFIPDLQVIVGMHPARVTDLLGGAALFSSSEDFANEYVGYLQEEGVLLYVATDNKSTSRSEAKLKMEEIARFKTPKGKLIRIQILTLPWYMPPPRKEDDFVPVAFYLDVQTKLLWVCLKNIEKYEADIGTGPVEVLQEQFEMKSFDAVTGLQTIQTRESLNQHHLGFHDLEAWTVLTDNSSDSKEKLRFVKKGLQLFPIKADWNVDIFSNKFSEKLDSRSVSGNPFSDPYWLSVESNPAKEHSDLWVFDVKSGAVYGLPIKKQNYLQAFWCLDGTHIGWSGHEGVNFVSLDNFLNHSAHKAREP